MAVHADDLKPTTEITRRELNVAIAAGALGVLSSKVLAAPLVAVAAQASVRIDTQTPTLVHRREWSIGSTDQSTQVLGNGRAMVHELGANIAYFRGPWISSPSLLKMTLTGPAGIRTVSSRERGTGIWHHRLYVGSDEAGEIVDYLEDGRACLRRVLSTKTELSFSIEGPPLANYADRYADHGTLIGQWPYGTAIFGDFLSSDPFTIQIVFAKDARVRIGSPIPPPPHERGVHGNFSMQQAVLTVPAGESEMWIAAGSDIEDCFDTADWSLARNREQALSATRLNWNTRLKGTRWPATERASALDLEPVVDDVLTLLLGHQSLAGSVCAGQFYALFYVRDQYGVSRALLELGRTADAKAILAYYFQVWQSYGRIHNAQSDGPRHWFHRAENDDVEMTGYLIVQAFDYHRATNDDAFLAEIFPMLEWALEAQHKQLFQNMLPFNGDETYVAGGIFPRTHLDDGSSEATLLYLAAVDRMLPWAGERKLWPATKLERYGAAAAAVKNAYGGNFIADGRLTVNRPRVPDPAVLPRFRYGVCLGQYDNDCLFLSDTEIAEDGRYFCYRCYPKRTRQTYDGKTFFIPSVALTSSLIGYRVVPEKAIAKTLTDALGVFTQNGKFSWPESRLPGYEAGVVLLALAEQGDPRSAELAGHVLEQRDSTGAWAEYYTGAQPQGCRCRPWESALSLLALLRYTAT